jgi:perosamine synthetase
MSDITAALGIAQLKKVDKIIQMRRRNAELLSAKLSKTQEIDIPRPPSNFSHVYQMYTIRVKNGQASRDALLAHLAQKGIMSKVYFPPVHLTYFYRNEINCDYALPVTEEISQQVLTLPMYSTLTESEIDYITNSVADFFPQK